MYRVLVVVGIILIIFAGCSRCSKEDANKVESQQSMAQENRVESDGSTAFSNLVDAGESTQIMHPNIRFVQTPDGKMVPEAAFKLKLPKMLNSQFLKNIAKEQGNQSKEVNNDSSNMENK